MSCLFISHVEEDARLAEELAHALEQAGYLAWYYERDALPGHSYLIQSGQAIGAAQAFILLISSASVGSHEVTKEVIQAHRRNRPILPILLDLSHAEFQERQPEWSFAIGSAASVDLRFADLGSVVARIAGGLNALGINPSSQPGSREGLMLTNQLLPETPPKIEKVWVSDAHQIDIHDLDRVVFQNRIIADFLHAGHKCFLSASKGLGKTLLLTYKRSLLSQSYQDARRKRAQAAVYFVPEGKPYLDFMGDLRSMSKDHDRFLSQLTNSKRTWGLAIRAAALSYHPGLLTEDDAGDLESLPARLQRWIQGSRVEPTVVFKELLTQPVSALNKIIDHSENFIEHKFRAIHSGTFIFIDKVDQAIRNLPQNAWINVQAGLVEAAWDVMTANAHVKVYAAIRQEAFSNYESDIKSNLFGAVLQIEYSREELSDLLDQLTLCYETDKSFKEFVRLNSVRHSPSGYCEDTFDLLHRHTLGRPRDLVIIASELSRKQAVLSESIFRRVVGDVSSSVLVPNVFKEMKVFLSCLAERQDRLRFLSMIPHNILTCEDAISIYCEFNRIDRTAYEIYGRDSEDLCHPFWELYRVGLLGVVTDNIDADGLVQKFKQAADFESDSQIGFPAADFYLVHPALNKFIAEHRSTGRYNIFEHVIVGHGYEWTPFYSQLVHVERQIFDSTDPELTLCLRQVLPEIVGLLNAGRTDELKMYVDTSQEWRALRERLLDADQVELSAGLDKLVTQGCRPSPVSTSRTAKS